MRGLNNLRISTDTLYNQFSFKNSSFPESPPQLPPPKRPLKKYAIVIALCAIVVIALILPIIPITAAKNGKGTFVVHITTDRLNFNEAVHQTIEASSSDFQYGKMSVTNGDTSQISIETSDWSLSIQAYAKSLTSSKVIATRYDANGNPLYERNESLVEGIFAVLSLNYTDNTSGIKTSLDKVLISESVGGLFDLKSYLSGADPNAVSSLPVGQIEITNRFTNATEIGFDYDPDKNTYVQNIVADISYDIPYSTHITVYSSILSLELETIIGALIGTVITAIVTFAIKFKPGEKKP